MNRRGQFIGVVMMGLVVGLLFGFVGEPQPHVDLFVALATVQGSFLAILITLMVLSIQISAEEYSSLSIPIAQNDRFLNGLIVLFTISILTDIFYILMLEDPLIVLPVNISISSGVSTALATVCLLLLIPGRHVMTDSITPESVLKSAKDDLTAADIPKPKTHRTASPPERSPLSTIEQVLISAQTRSDETTIQHSIYEMGEAAKKLIRQTELSAEDIDGETLFECLDTCDEAARDGGNRRLRLVATIQSEIACELIQNSLPELAHHRTDALVDLLTATNANEEIDVQLLATVTRTAIISEEPSPVLKSATQFQPILDEMEDDRDESSLSMTPDAFHDLVATSLIPTHALLAAVNTRVCPPDNAVEPFHGGIDCLDSMLTIVEHISVDGFERDPQRTLLKKWIKIMGSFTATVSKKPSQELSRIVLMSTIRVAIQLDESPSVLSKRLQRSNGSVDNLSQPARKLLKQNRANAGPQLIDMIETSDDELRDYLEFFARPGSPNPPRSS